MQRKRFFMSFMFFLVLFSFPVYAAASSSNADVITDLPDPADSSADDTGFDDSTPEEDSIEEEPVVIDPDPAAPDEEEPDEEDSEEDSGSETALLQEILDLLGGVFIASDSNAPEESVEDPQSDPVLGEVNPYFPALLLAETDPESFVNCLRFDVSVGGSDYTLLFSPSYRDQIYVDSQDRLWNMGTSQIQGLVIEGEFNPYNTTGTLVYLAPCLGNNYSTNRNYGSPNWFREYYWTTSSGYERLSYDDTYVQILVTKTYFPFVVGDSLMYMIIFLVGGGVLLCWLNRYRRY